MIFWFLACFVKTQTVTVSKSDPFRDVATSQLRYLHQTQSMKKQADRQSYCFEMIPLLNTCDDKRTHLLCFHCSNIYS